MWRVALPAGTPERVTGSPPTFPAICSRPRATGSRLGDRNMACSDVSCANVTAPGPGHGGRAYDETFVRHWDTWAEPNVRSRIFTFPSSTAVHRARARRWRRTSPAIRRPSRSAAPRNWLEPRRPHPLFHPARGGPSEPNSTNLDVYAVPGDASAAPVNLTDANEATDVLPAVSPDGRWLAYVAMARPTYEADRQVVQLRNLETGATRALTGDWDRSVRSLAWAADSRNLYVTAGEVLDTPLFRVDVRTGRATRLTRAGTVSNFVPARDGSVLYTLNSLQAPDDLYRLDRRGRSSRLTSVNADRLASSIRDGRAVSFAGAGGAQSGARSSSRPTPPGDCRSPS